MLYEDPVTGLDIEKQTLTINSGKLVKYGTLIIATGYTASRFCEKIGGSLPWVHYIRDVADADSLISSLGKAKKLVVVGGGYIGMEVAASTVAWKLDTTVIHEIGQHLASFSSLSFSREKIAWDATKPSRETQQPCRALYG